MPEYKYAFQSKFSELPLVITAKIDDDRFMQGRSVETLQGVPLSEVGMRVEQLKGELCTWSVHTVKEVHRPPGALDVQVPAYKTRTFDCSNAVIRDLLLEELRTQQAMVAMSLNSARLKAAMVSIDLFEAHPDGIGLVGFCDNDDSAHKGLHTRYAQIDGVIGRLGILMDERKAIMRVMEIGNFVAW